MKVSYEKEKMILFENKKIKEMENIKMM